MSPATSDDTRDAHLRSGDFFDAEKFPRATFKSTSITKHADAYLVKGDLSVRGVTKEVELRATFEGKGKDPRGVSARRSRRRPQSTVRTGA
jgi:polyisoprenoid-binding protein YceI